APEKGRLAEVLLVSERSKSCLRFRRDSSHNKLICLHVAPLFNKSNPLPILHSAVFCATLYRRCLSWESGANALGRVIQRVSSPRNHSRLRGIRLLPCASYAEFSAKLTPTLL